MPGLIKIGRTNGEVTERVRQLNPAEGIEVGVALHELKIFADITKHYRCELTSRFHRFLL
jgi:hypothetical protein